jgi:AraC family transcriptional regulator of adaptative response / DNA-3-methyladenine glycosylase II
VKTTRIFCRPVCPAIPPKESNVTYFPSAAAAAEAGFRACLRCRPECAPGTPAWIGASALVSRGLRLIAGGAMNTGSLETLAARLGVGSRHLRRLFLEHVGAAPIAVVQTQRLLSAKRLIDETDLPLTTIALAAGYRSIRRFNAAFLETYHRSPRELRQAGSSTAQGPRRNAEAGPGPTALRSGRHQASAARPTSSRSAFRPPPFSFELRYRPPFDWDRILAFLTPRAIPGVEIVEAGTYRRSIVIGGERGWIDVSGGRGPALHLRLDFPDAAHVLRIVSSVRRMFDLDADPMCIGTTLLQDDLLAPIVEKSRGLRVPGAWDGFELGVRAILGQQVSVRGATALAGRLVEQFGDPMPDPPKGLTHTFPSAEVITGGSFERLGLPSQRANAIRGFASAVAAGTVTFDGSMETGEFCTRLMRIPGVGPWTAEYMAMRGLGDPDAFPAADLGLLRATGCRTARALEERSQAWRPWRAYAAMHLWMRQRSEGPKVRPRTSSGRGELVEPRGSVRRSKGARVQESESRSPNGGRACPAREGQYARGD